MTDTAQRFADRLVELEGGADLEAFVAEFFTDDVVLSRPETGQELQGSDGARTFWQEYLGQFDQVRSSFSRVHDGSLGVLEWTSAATLPDGTEITYAGVSLLDLSATGRISRFTTYYDTSVFQPRPQATDDVDQGTAR